MRRTLVILIVAGLLSSARLAVCNPPEDLDPVAEAIRESLDQDLSVGLVEQDGLTFEQREAVYGFSVAPELLEDPIMYIGDGGVGFLIDGPDGLTPPDFPLFEKLSYATCGAEGCLGLWVSNDEFHRALAGDAENLVNPGRMGEEETLYTMHVEPAPGFECNPDGTLIPESETVGLMIILTPIP